MIRTGPFGRRRRSRVVTAIASATAILFIGLAISRGVAAGPEAVPLPQATEYLPSISDLMIATIQPRHERIWRAEQDGNWDFAAYEFGNLKGAFNRLGHAHPTEHEISFPDMIATVTGPPCGSCMVMAQIKPPSTVRAASTVSSWRKFSIPAVESIRFCSSVMLAAMSLRRGSSKVNACASS